MHQKTRNVENDFVIYEIREPIQKQLKKIHLRKHIYYFEIFFGYYISQNSYARNKYFQHFITE